MLLWQHVVLLHPQRQQYRQQRLQQKALVAETAAAETDEAASTEAESTDTAAFDLAGKKIGVQLGTTGDQLATEYEQNDGSTVERFNKGADAIQALKQGKIDCVVIDYNPAKAFVERMMIYRFWTKSFLLKNMQCVSTKTTAS